MFNIKIAPSVLAADFLRLGDQLEAAEKGDADRFHIDIMDGHFVPNITLGVPVVESIRRGTSLPLETHLMVNDVERLIEAFIRAGSDAIIVHQENSPNLHRTMEMVKQFGKKAGVALNPSTPVSTLEEIAKDLDLILIMTVNPGFGGQSFIQSTVGKIRKVRQMIQKSNLKCELEVDGGINIRTAPIAVEAGADVLVAGTAVFQDKDGPQSGLRRLMQACEQVGVGG